MTADCRARTGLEGIAKNDAEKILMIDSIRCAKNNLLYFMQSKTKSKIILNRIIYGTHRNTTCTIYQLNYYDLNICIILLRIGKKIYHHQEEDTNGEKKGSATWTYHKKKRHFVFPTYFECQRSYNGCCKSAYLNLLIMIIDRE